jgi:hypothetical protein
MKKISSSISSFEKLRTTDHFYIDKTSYIWNLIKDKGESYFLSRPRRFGKSLTLSTLKAIFEGKKELFEGLYIYNMPYDWKKYPVIHLNFSNCEITTAAELTAYLNNQLENIANSFDIKLRGELLTNRFENLIIDVHQLGEVVILLDEYDKPILDNIYNSNINDIFKVLKGFYSNIKKTEELLHFAFITGVTCHVSLFSNLNNLTDITLNSQYATMLGYTQNELDENLGEMYAKFAKQKSLEVGTLKNEVKNWYNGYRFHENAQTVYNPVSIAKFCENNGEFNNYWFDTGIPNVLINIIKQKDSYFNQILKRPISSVAFKSFEIDKIDPVVLAFQTGYLTIKNTEQYLGKTRYYLDFPNIEVADAFNVLG